MNGDRIYADVENERLVFERQAPELAAVFEQSQVPELQITLGFG